MKLSMRRIVSSLAIAGCLATAGLPIAALAQGLPGLVIFSGVDRANQLRYRLDFGGIPSRTDRYRLRIPADKMNLAVAQFAITYPESFRGTFDRDKIEVRVRGRRVALDEVNWDQENRLIEIYPVDPIAAGTPVELVFSNVQNPRFAGTHYFNALIRSPGDVPLLRYVGTWVIGIGRP